MAEKKEKRYVSDNAQLMAEWDWDKNIELDLSPFVLTCGSNKYAWWKCEKGHSYEARIYNRNKGHGCPYCSGRKITHENSLAFSRPDLLKEWNYSKNSNLDPYTIGKSVSKKVWWICPKGHEWQATVNSRRYGVGCPICAKDAQTSFSEQVIFFYAKKFFLNAKNRAIINDCELDIYIPELSLGIEYDGYFWHKNKNVEDNRKSIKLQKSGIRLIRIKEQKEHKETSEIVINESEIETTITYTYSENPYALEQVLKTLFSFINQYWGTNIGLKFNIDRDRNEILQQYYSSEKENSLLNNFPELESEWDLEKNGNIALSFVPQKSGKKFWWKCKNGHKWQAKVYNRANGNGCPVCAGKKILKGFNDLATKRPDLVAHWDYQRNQIQPTEVSENSGKIVWWTCNNGHQYEMRIADKTNGYGCPYCSGRRASNMNNLYVNYPHIAAEWSSELNQKNPYEITCGAKGLWWWECEKGHHYQDTITHRIRGNNCPFCSGHKVLIGFNDLSTTSPNLSKEWNYEKNGELTPVQVTKGSNKKVWWKCRTCGYEWQAQINSRQRGSGCPQCAKNRRKKKNG